MLTHKSLEGFLRVAAQKKVDGLPNEDDFVVRRLNYQRTELLGLQEAYGSDPAYKEEVQSIAAEISRIDDALGAYPEATSTVATA